MPGCFVNQTGARNFLFDSLRKAFINIFCYENRSRIELKTMEEEARSFRVDQAQEAREQDDGNCNC